MAAKTARRYFDDPDEGPAKLTSHPKYVALAGGDEFFYSCTDDFAPFGSDAGADTLSSLEDWLRAPRPRTVRAFIASVIDDWDMRLPDLRETREAEVRKWLADETLETAVGEIDRMVIATAFAQYKITGAVDAEVHELALAAAAREMIATAHARAKYPTWKHAKAKTAADAKLRKALDAMR